jgi:asparagine synthase (glutamine-hydrolysing)
VIETGLALPERAKLAKGFGKWILRGAMRGRVPDAIRLNRDKRGFDVNQDRWIDRGLGSLLRDALEERKAAIADWLPPDQKIDELFSDAALKTVRPAFAEAVSLIWLGNRA